MYLQYTVFVLWYMVYATAVRVYDCTIRICGIIRPGGYFREDVFRLLIVVLGERPSITAVPRWSALP